MKPEGRTNNKPGIGWWRDTTRRERDMMRRLDQGWGLSAIAREWGVTKQRTTAVAKRLVEMGLLRRLDWYRYQVVDRSYINHDETERNQNG